MDSYYSKKLSSVRLKRCYELAPPAVRRYLSAEMEFVRGHVTSMDRVLELGCGYGRVLRDIAPVARFAVGIDTSLTSLVLAQDDLRGLANAVLVCMDAVQPAFSPAAFDVVFCIQNGISAFQVDQRELLRRAVSVTRSGGKVLFSSYAEEFWEERLRWFRIQAANGLVGEIDEIATGDGVIVCKDGFKSTTVRPEEFMKLADGLGTRAIVQTVAGSSVFCEIDV